MSELIGQQFGNYQLTRLLGKGGFAEVYLGEHTRLKMSAAIKILHTHLSEEGAEAFQREAQAIASLVHPHIIRILDFDVQNGRPFLVLDFAPNGSLRKLHPHGSRVPLLQIVDYVNQIAEALQYAHEHKLIHRDVKPENMLLGPQNELFLSDFGIVTIAHSTTSSMSMQSSMGTLPYMAPEQIQAHPRPASDQYALAITVYQWLCGELPFQGSSTEIIAKHLAVSPPSLCEKVPGIPPEVEQVVITALAKDPKARFASVRDFANALEQASQKTLLNNASSSPTPMEPINHIQSHALAITEPDTHQPQSEPQPIMPPLFSSHGEEPLVRPTPTQGISRRALLTGLITGSAGLTVLGLWALATQHKISIPGNGLPLNSQSNTPILYTYTGHQYNSTTGSVSQVLWSPDSKRITSVGSSSTGKDLTIHTWDIDGGHVSIYRPLKGIQHFDLIWTVDGLRFAWVTNGTQLIHVTDISRKLDILTYNGHVNFKSTSFIYDTVQGLAWSPDRTRIASIGEGGIHVWDAINGNDIALYQVKPQNEPGYTELGALQVALRWSYNSERILSWGGLDGIIHIWRAADGSEIAHYQKHWEEYKNNKDGVFIYNVTWSPDSKKITSIGTASFQDQNIAHIWNPDNGQQICTHDIKHLGDSIWSPNSELLASPAGIEVQVWNAANGKTISTYPSHFTPDSIAWSPDGKRVASDSDQVVIWDPTTGLHAVKLDIEGEVSWSPDGKLLAITPLLDGTIIIARAEAAN